MVCHPSRIFPPKEPEQESQNRFSLLPTAKPCPLTSCLLPPTHDLTVSCIGWVQTGDVWALHVPHFYVCPKSICCLCVRRGLEVRLRSLPSVLNFLWCELFYDFPFFYGLLPLRAGLYLMVGFAFFQPTLCCYHFLPYHSVILAVMLFDPILLALLGLAVYSSHNDSVWPLVLLLHYLRALMSHSLPLGHPWPVCFSWASLAIFPILHSYEVLLISLAFSGPITLSLILGAHGLTINPLLSLLTLLWACYGPFSLFFITYCPWVCHFSFSGLL